MKNLKFLTFCLVIFSMTLLNQSCEDDPCKDVTCQNGGVCVDGTCDCPDGYSGTSCEVADSDQFLGTYTVVENCGLSGIDNYSITITASGNSPQEVQVANLYDGGDNLNATIDGNNITIPSQVGGTGVTYDGSGSISGNTLTLSFIVAAQGSSDTCTATCTKQ